jgi:hypothetical protein
VAINAGKYGGLSGGQAPPYSYDPYEQARQQKVYEEYFRQATMAASAQCQQGPQVTPIEKSEVANRDIILLLEEV